MNEESGRKSFLADVLAHQGRFTEAARLYRENNEAQKAVVRAEPMSMCKK